MCLMLSHLFVCLFLSSCMAARMFSELHYLLVSAFGKWLVRKQWCDIDKRFCPRWILRCTFLLTDHVSTLSSTCLHH